MIKNTKSLLSWETFQNLSIKEVLELFSRMGTARGEFVFGDKDQTRCALVFIREDIERYFKALCESDKIMVDEKEEKHDRKTLH